jgi:hypothetical protein
MLRKIENQEIMTTWDAMKKYERQYFVMLITDVVDMSGQKDLGYVMYAADKRKELNQIPQDEYKGKQIAFLEGWDVDPFPILDRVVYHDQF